MPFEVIFVTPDPGTALDPDRDRGLCSLVRSALDGGADAVQLRAKSAPAGQLLRLACQLRGVSDRAGATLLVNDRLDVALAAGAGGIQLGEAGIPVSAALSLLRRWSDPSGTSRLLVGASAHSPEGVREKFEAGADFVVFGNIFPTASKPGVPGCGLEVLSQAVGAAEGRPVIAIGGICAANAGAVRRAGASGIAVIGAIAAATDPRAAARELVASWRAGEAAGR